MFIATVHTQRHVRASACACAEVALFSGAELTCVLGSPVSQSLIMTPIDGFG